MSDIRFYGSYCAIAFFLCRLLECFGERTYLDWISDGGPGTVSFYIINVPASTSATARASAIALDCPSIPVR